MRWLLFLLALVAGCDEPGLRNASNPAPAERRAEATSVHKQVRQAGITTLAGDWRVAGIDGKSLDGPYGLALHGDEEEFWWEPRCARVVRSYQIRGQTIAFTRPNGMPAPGSPTLPVCAIALPPQLGEVIDILDASTTISRTASNGVQIAGAGHSVILFSQ